MKRFFAWSAFLFGSLFFILPLLGMTEFSLSMRRGVYSFDAYARACGSAVSRRPSAIPSSWRSSPSFGVLLVVPTAYWVRLRMPSCGRGSSSSRSCRWSSRPIVIVFGYIRLYNTSSWLPLTGSATGTNILLMFGYTTLALPVHVPGRRHGSAHDRRSTLTEAAQSLGAGWGRS
jgi:putative spermidine/putrescine transport system permease protein